MLRLIVQNLRNSVNAARTAAASNVSVTVPTTQNVQRRSIAVSSAVNLKQIEQVTEGNVTKIEARIVESERAPFMLEQKDQQGCTLCKIHPLLKYTDVLILSQFLRADGCLLPRRVTGVCWGQQQRLKMLVNKAQRAGLLPQYRPALRSGKPRTNHRSNYKWKRYNVYFKD